jgi:hypothetical protein
VGLQHRCSRHPGFGCEPYHLGGIENDNGGALCIPLGVLATYATGEVVLGSHVDVLLVSLAHTFSARGVQPS